MTEKKILYSIEQGFEKILWSSRFIILIGVIAGVFGAFTLFIFGTYDMIITLSQNPLNAGHHASNAIVGAVIGAIDLYLIGIVVLLFSFGTYELFISKIDVGHGNTEIKVLEIKDLDELKNKILKVIVMVLVVSFFKQVLEMDFRTPLEMLYLALSILLLSASTFFLKK